MRKTKVVLRQILRVVMKIVKELPREHLKLLKTWLRTRLLQAWIKTKPYRDRTEKPDVVAGKILEGKVAILVDGSPIVLTVTFAAFAAIILEGIILSILHIYFIVGLGVDLSTRELFPLLNSSRLIRVTGFLDRLDLFIIVVIVFNGFIKTGFFLYASVAGTAQLLGIKNQKSLVVPIGMAVCIGSVFVANNYPKHLRIGLDFTVKYIHLPIQIVIPILALCLHYLMNGFENNAEEQKNNQCPKSSG